MKTPLIVDLFAGGGGASCGIEVALGRSVDIAVNHDAEAVSLHQANHPNTLHFVSDVFEVDPRAVCGDRPVGLLWASPDCTYHSKARGGKPHRDRNKARRRRGLAGVVVRWAASVRPAVIALENVEEFQHWGPLLPDGTPCPARRGRSFRRWVAQLRNIGYAVEWRELRACDYGAPTIRKRLFVIARCDGQPIIWPRPTHGKPCELPFGGVKPWRSAAECIDWSIPVPSIFDRAKPLAAATLERIAAGVKRYVIEAEQPYFVTYAQQGGGNRSAELPLHTVTASTKDQNCLVAAFLAKHYTGVIGSDLREPIGTITSIDHHSLVSAFLAVYYGSERDGQSLADPMRTIPTRDRFGLVTLRGELHRIADIGMRMLQPRELYRAQGFPDSYIIDRGSDGRQLSKASQVRMCGNSVCPPIAAAIVRANVRQQAEALRDSA